MAKSLRSKWRRKMKAVKRERYGAKEMKRLNEMLIKAGDIQFLPEIKEEKEEEMAVDGAELEADTITTESSRRSRIDIAKKQRKSGSVDAEVDLTQTKDNDADETLEKMAVDGERIFRRKTMRDQFGQYPNWMNKRKIRTQQNKNKRLKKRAKSLKRK